MFFYLISSLFPSVYKRRKKEKEKEKRKVSVLR